MWSRAASAPLAASPTAARGRRFRSDFETGEGGRRASWGARPGPARAARGWGPHGVEARYSGAGGGGDARVGRGRGEVARPGPGAAALPLQPLTVAVRQPRFADRDALVAEF